MELIRSQAVPERLDTVDKQDRDLVLVKRKQFRFTFDIDFLERVEPGAARFAYLGLHFFAKMAARFGIKDNSHSRFHFVFALRRKLVTKRKPV